MQGPRRISDVEHHLDLNGYIMPWRHGEPVFIVMWSSTDHFLPLFSAPRKLREFMHDINYEYDSIKRIDSWPEFIASIPAEIRIAIDPHYIENGRLRFLEIVRNTLH